MIIGLIGLANAGKTTVFNALTGAQAAVTAYAIQKADPNLASVAVADDRVTRLCEMYSPKITTHATVDFIDFPGVAEGAARDGLFPSLTMGLVKNTEALALVLRNFDDVLMGPADPLGDLELIETELFISDLIIAERRLEKIEQLYKKGKKSTVLESEERLLHRISDHLGNNRPIRAIELDKAEIHMIKSFHFLTKKPILVILNSSEENYEGNAGPLPMIKDRHPSVEFAGLFEMDLSSLEDGEEKKMFTEEMGISESARDRLTRLAYASLGCISFFTVGADEVRAWTIYRGQTAVQAAGTIHNDLARGFIRAECFSFDDLVRCGSEKGIRENGVFRLEGKNYTVKDGDILSIRFNL